MGNKYVACRVGCGIFVVGSSFGLGEERVKNERKCCDAEAEMKNARKRKTEMLPTAIRMLNSSNSNNNNKNNSCHH